MQYSDWTTALGGLLQYPIIAAATSAPSSNTDFNNILPRAIDYTENRITRDMDLLATRVVDSSTALTANSRTVTLPTANTFFVIQGVNVITPYTATPATGYRNRLQMTSKDFIDIIWPTEQGGLLNTVPQYAALLNTTTMIVAPTPDQNYPLEYTGVIRLVQMSAGNPTNYITLSYAELYLAASMIFMSGFQRDFGQQSDDPKVAQSWENQYQTLLKSASEEEQRRKNQGPNWSSFSATPLSSPRP